MLKLLNFCLDLATKNKDLQVFIVAAKVFFEHLNGQFAIVLDANIQINSKKVSTDAIDKFITNQLQIKFGVAYRYKLVERLIELGYHEVIPEVFAGKFFRNRYF